MAASSCFDVTFTVSRNSSFVARRAAVEAFPGALAQRRQIVIGCSSHHSSCITLHLDVVGLAWHTSALLRVSQKKSFLCLQHGTLKTSPSCIILFVLPQPGLSLATYRSLCARLPLTPHPWQIMAIPCYPGARTPTNGGRRGSPSASGERGEKNKMFF